MEDGKQSKSIAIWCLSDLKNTLLYIVLMTFWNYFIRNTFNNNCERYKFDHTLQFYPPDLSIGQQIRRVDPGVCWAH